MLNKFINQIEPLITYKDKKSINDYLKLNRWITESKFTKKFEELFAKKTHSKYAIALPNGTLTLTTILLSLGIKPNDEVIVPSYTMVATANSVQLIGAKPIFCDISKDNLCLSHYELENKISKKTKAIIYVTLNGRSGDIKKIKDICNKKKIYLIEDSAHSIGSYFKKIHHGNFGIASSFSFSTPKIITTGQGGMIVTNNNKIYKKIKKIKNFGRSSDGNDLYEDIGYNFKFTDLQAVLGISQISDLEKRIKKKKEIFQYYWKLLSKNKNIKMFNFEKNETPWFVDIYVEKPKKLQNYLKLKKISSRLVYPSLNTLKIFQAKGNFNNSNYYCKRGLWLPSSLSLKKNEIKMISKYINDFFENSYA
tara:strand:+ start:803 stop:1897 length:1095 start_codon:yes stop_codon:yes gene_type:complete